MIRAGIEATLSQNVRTCGLRRTRYRGLPRTHVQHVLTGLACNVTRITDWIADPTPTSPKSFPRPLYGRQLTPHKIANRVTPFTWTKTAEEILDSLARFCQRISGAGH